MSYQDYNDMPPQVYGPQSSSLAVISLIAGIASFFILPLLGAIAAIITGSMAKKEIRASRGRMSGEGMASAGMILGWINIGLSVIGICLAVLVLVGGVALPACLIPFVNNY
jgi:hypothetical protein